MSTSKFIKNLFTQQEKLTSDKWGFFPDSDPEAFHFYQLQQHSVWVPSEVNFSKDFVNFSALSIEKQTPLKRCLVIFQTLDGAVIDTVCLRRILEAPTLMEKLVSVKQMDGEATHSESYRMQFDSIIPDPIEREKLLRAIDSEVWLQRYEKFIEKYLESDEPEIIELASQAFLEGVVFVFLFAIIFWYKKSPDAIDIPGVTESNELIIRDESIHCDWAIIRFLRLLKKEPEPEKIRNRVIDICREIMEIIENAVPEILEHDLPGLTQTDLLTYSKFIADRVLTSMTCPKIYNVENPLEYMNSIGGPSKTNPYETTTTNYKRGNRHEKEFQHNLEEVEF